jgi:hypothetical protein
VAALALVFGVGAGCEKKSETVVVEDESGTFEEIGEGIDKTKEAAEDAADEAEKTADKVDEAVSDDGNP